MTIDPAMPDKWGLERIADLNLELFPPVAETTGERDLSKRHTGRWAFDPRGWLRLP